MHASSRKRFTCREAVAEILAPPPAPDLSRHISLLTLSRDKSGRPRLLTTNFDTLFERAARADGVECRSHAAKSLPRPGTPGDHGILHLHGRLGDRAIGLDQGDLILTTADFGDAYLRDGWASQYVEDRMRVNTLVLVGYHAIRHAAMATISSSIGMPIGNKVPPYRRGEPCRAAMSRRRANVPLRRRRCCRLRYREAREKPVLATRKAVLVCRLPVEFGRFGDTLREHGESVIGKT
ncbi:hypothetical protein FOM02_35075 [Bradyrhizobium sp. SEMIA]|nr:hypothetical protein FOM02_35075 [Bradyrhizobium sp. SEMIA]